jgi:hypothetical protein
VPGTLIAKNLMLAYKWGLKTVYYSLINKVGAKDTSSNTEIKSSTITAVAVEYEDADCEACKL